MGQRVDAIIERIQRDKGTFFVARVALRLTFPLGKGEAKDTPENEEQLIQACIALGFDPREG